jgi:dihydropteroate synthase
MGVLNVTPDSFSDGGLYQDPDRMMDHVQTMIAAGADIIDVGAESTRPGYEPLTAGQEWERLEGPLRLLRERWPALCLSVDTQKAPVAVRALDAGVDILNDIQGLSGDPEMLQALARTEAGLVMMFNRPAPWESGQVDIQVMTRFLTVQTERALKAGITPDRIMVDPGLGFAYGVEDNWTVLQHLGAFSGIGAGILLGPSRKRFLGVVTGKPAAQRDVATAAVCALAVPHHVDVVRVHNVDMARDALAVADRWHRHG